MDFYFLLFLLAIFLLLVIYFLRVVLKPDKVILLERIIAKAENADWKETYRSGKSVSLETKIGPYKVALYRRVESYGVEYTLDCYGKNETVVNSDDIFQDLIRDEYNINWGEGVRRKLERLYNKANETEKKRLEQEEAELRKRKREAEETKRYKKLFKK